MDWLNLPKEPYWLEMPSGLRAFVRPLRTPINETAKARMRRLSRELIEHVAAVRAAGGTVDDLPNLTTADGLEGAATALYGEALAIAGIIRWVPPGGTDDQAVRPAPEDVVEWMASYPGDADHFVLQYTAPITRAIAAGKALRPSPNGTSAAGPNTAQGAEKPARRARKAAR